MTRQSKYGPAPTSPMEKILRRTEIIAGPLDTPCWIWTGRTDTKNQYGHVFIGSLADGTWRNGTVHRIAYEEMVGPIPEGLQLDHLCRVGTCWCPEHLEPVTPGENVRRYWAARRIERAS